MRFGLPATLAVALVATASAAVAQTSPPVADTILVLDVSGSMWGKIEGRAKIEIAREVVRGVLADWPQGQRLGLMAYGHRRAGDCADIETVTPVQTVDSKAMAAKVDALTPRGKTPLTEAVRRAAKELGHTDRPATVILVSDGIESCNADPCAVAAELEKSGAAFTAHVIGFDVRTAEQSQLRCLADATGGKFFTASSATELKEALKAAGTTAVKAEKAAPPKLDSAAVTFRALHGPQGPELTGDVTWTLVPPQGVEAPAIPEQGHPVLRLPPGTWHVEAAWHELVGKAEFTVVAGKPQTVTAVIPLAKASLTAPASVMAGSFIEVAWTGPNGPTDYVTLVPAKAESGTFVEYVYTKDGSPVRLRAPHEAGSYEARYQSDGSTVVLARAPVTVTAAAVTLTAPASVAAGAPFDVAWTGPNGEGDHITVVPVKAAGGTFEGYAYAKEGSPAHLRAPHEPGAYEVRYQTNGSTVVMGRVPVTVTAAAAALTAPTAVEGGATFEVAWTGPNNQGDYITLVRAAAATGTYDGYVYTKEGSPVRLRAPYEAGAYEVRYQTEGAERALARAKVTVNAPKVAITAPAEVRAGDEFEVTWTGPNNEKDYITIVEKKAAPGTYENYEYTQTGSPLRLTAPAEPGSYELRYQSDGSEAVLARVPIRVKP